MHPKDVVFIDPIEAIVYGNMEENAIILIMLVTSQFD